MNKKIRKLALRDLRVNKKRNRLTVMSILISVFLIGVVIALCSSFYNYMLNEMKISGEEVLTVAFGNRVNTLNYRYLTIYTDADVELIRNTEGVKSATGIKGLGVDEITYDGGKQIITSTLYGIDKEYLDNLNIEIAKGKMPDDDKEVLLGYSVHNATKLNVGDNFQVKIYGQVEDFNVAGIIEHQEEQAFNTVPAEINQMIAVSNNSRYVVDSKYSYVSAIAENVDELSEISNNICENLKTDEKLMEALEGTGLEPIVASRKDVKDMLASWFDYIALFIMGMIVLIGIIASINIINVFAITIQEKHKDIAVYKIVGASEKQVRSIFIFQSITLGIRGSVIGTIMSIIVSVIVIELFGWNQVSEIQLYVIPFVVGIIVSLLAGYIVSKKTDYIDVNILMNE